MKRRVYQAAPTKGGPAPVKAPDLTASIRRRDAQMRADEQRQERAENQNNLWMQQQAAQNAKELQRQAAQIEKQDIANNKSLQVWGEQMIEESDDFFKTIGYFSETAAKVGNFFSKQATENDKAMAMAKAMEDYRAAPFDTTELDVKEGLMKDAHMQTTAYQREANKAGLPNYALSIAGQSWMARQTYIAEVAKLHGKSYHSWLGEQFRSNDEQEYTVMTPEGPVTMTPKEAAETHNPHIQAGMAAAMRPSYFKATGLIGLDQDVAYKYFMPDGLDGENKVLDQLNKNGVEVKNDRLREQATHYLYQENSVNLYLSSVTATLKNGKSYLPSKAHDDLFTAISTMYQAGSKSKAEILDMLHNDGLDYANGDPYVKHHKTRYDAILVELQRIDKLKEDTAESNRDKEKENDAIAILDKLSNEGQDGIPDKLALIQAREDYVRKYRTSHPILDNAVEKYNATDLTAKAEVATAQRLIENGQFTEDRLAGLSWKARKLLRDDIQIWRAQQDAGHGRLVKQIQQKFKSTLNLAPEVDITGTGAIAVNEFYKDVVDYMNTLPGGMSDAEKIKLATAWIDETFKANQDNPKSDYFIAGDGLPNFFKSRFGGTRQELQKASQLRENERIQRLKASPTAWRTKGFINDGVMAASREDFMNGTPGNYTYPKFVTTIKRLNPSMSERDIFNQLLKNAGLDAVPDLYKQAPIIEGMTPEQRSAVQRILDTDGTTGETASRVLYEAGYQQGGTPVYQQRAEYQDIKAATDKLPMMDAADGSAFYQFYLDGLNKGAKVKPGANPTIPDLMRQVSLLHESYKDYPEAQQLIQQVLPDPNMNPAAAFAALSLISGNGPLGISTMSPEQMGAHLRKFNEILMRETGDPRFLQGTKVRRLTAPISDVSMSLGAKDGDLISDSTGHMMHRLAPVPKGSLIYGPEDYIAMAKIIDGEAANNDDIFLVAGTMANRHSQGYEGATSIRDVANQPGQYEAHPGGIDAMPTTARHREIAAMLSSEEGQRKLIRALQILRGRTDFKGRTMYSNRAASDIQFGEGGNFSHYSNQKHPSDPPPAVVPLDWQRLIIPN